MLAQVQEAASLAATSRGRLVLYDGECGFCDRFVQWLLVKDSNARFQFAPLQGPTARAILGRHTLPAGLDSVVYVVGSGDDERVHWESRGAFLILRDLGYPWAMLSWFRFLPRVITDLPYRAFAKIRFRVFGRLDECRIPTPSERARFLP